MLISESQVQRPLLIHTGNGGKNTDTTMRQISDKHSQQHMLFDYKEYHVYIETSLHFSVRGMTGSFYRLQFMKTICRLRFDRAFAIIYYFY